VVTNAHVVADADAISVEFAGGEVVRVTPDHVRIDGDRDVAVIEVYTGDAPSVAIGDPSSVRRGQRLIALGAARTEAHPLLRHLVRVRVDEVGGADGVGRRSFDPAGAQPEQDVRRSGSGRARVPAHAGRSSDGALPRLVVVESAGWPAGGLRPARLAGPARPDRSPSPSTVPIRELLGGRAIGHAAWWVDGAGGAQGGQEGSN